MASVESLSLSNSVRRFVRYYSRGDRDSADLAVAILCRNFSEVIADPSIAEELYTLPTYDEFVAILDSAQLVASTKQLFDAVLRWAAYDYSRRGRSDLEALLTLITFAVTAPGSESDFLSSDVISRSSRLTNLVTKLISQSQKMRPMRAEGDTASGCTRNLNTFYFDITKQFTCPIETETWPFFFIRQGYVFELRVGTNKNFAKNKEGVAAYIRFVRCEVGYSHSPRPLSELFVKVSFQVERNNRSFVSSESETVDMLGLPSRHRSFGCTDLVPSNEISKLLDASQVYIVVKLDIVSYRTTCVDKGGLCSCNLCAPVAVEEQPCTCARCTGKKEVVAAEEIVVKPSKTEVVKSSNCSSGKACVVKTKTVVAETDECRHCDKCSTEHCCDCDSCKASRKVKEETKQCCISCKKCAPAKSKSHCCDCKACQKQEEDCCSEKCSCCICKLGKTLKESFCCDCKNKPSGKKEECSCCLCKPKKEKKEGCDCCVCAAKQKKSGKCKKVKKKNCSCSACKAKKEKSSKKEECECYICKSRREKEKEENKCKCCVCTRKREKEKECSCCFCKSKREKEEKKECDCSVCQSKRKEKEKEECSCCICKEEKKEKASECPCCICQSKKKKKDKDVECSSCACKAKKEEKKDNKCDCSVCKSVKVEEEECNCCACQAKKAKKSKECDCSICKSKKEKKKVECLCCVCKAERAEKQKLEECSCCLCKAKKEEKEKEELHCCACINKEEDKKPKCECCLCSPKVETKCCTCESCAPKKIKCECSICDSKAESKHKCCACEKCKPKAKKVICCSCHHCRTVETKKAKSEKCTCCICRPKEKSPEEVVYWKCVRANNVVMQRDKEACKTKHSKDHVKAKTAARSGVCHKKKVVAKAKPSEPKAKDIKCHEPPQVMVVCNTSRCVKQSCVQVKC